MVVNIYIQSFRSLDQTFRKLCSSLAFRNFSILVFVRLSVRLTGFRFNFLLFLKIFTLTLYLDTDSLIYQIKIEDVYEDFKERKEMSDVRNYSDKSKYYDNCNKLIVGQTKNETGGVAIKECARLKPKMYLFLVDSGSKYKKG